MTPEQGLVARLCGILGVMQVDEISPRESLESEMSRWERTEPWRTPNLVE
jgi:hypothetical protein